MGIRYITSNYFIRKDGVVIVSDILSHPTLRDILSSTYGIILYQEQVIEIAKTVAGFTLEEADEVREILGKKKEDKMKRLRQRFVSRSVENNFPKDKAEELFAVLEKYSAYSFNKCLPNSFPLWVLDHKESVPRLTNLLELRTIWKSNKEIGLVSPSDEYMEIEEISLVGLKPVLEITLNDGNSFSATPEHQFLAEVGKKEEKLCLSEIIQRDLAFVSKGSEETVRRIYKIQQLYPENVWNITLREEPHCFKGISNIIVYNSHSMAYATNAYWTAYLKTYYPAYFIAETINSKIDGDSAKKELVIQKMLKEARRLNIKIIAPDINKSDYRCKVFNGELVLGLGCVKGLGNQYVEKIVSDRHINGKFHHLGDFCARTWGSRVQAAKVELLIKAGALKNILSSVLEALEGLPFIEKTYKKYIKKDPIFLHELLIKDPLFKKTHNDFSPDEILEMQKEIYGFYVAGHPLENAKIPEGYFRNWAEIEESQNELGEKIGIALIFSKIKIHLTKATQSEMAFIKAEDDQFSPVELTVFPKTWQAIKREYGKNPIDKPFLVLGKIEPNRKMIVDKVIPLF